MKNITSNTYKVSPSNKESHNEPILENNTDHIDSENYILHELLDVEFEHLQQRYQHLLDQSPNQPEQTISNDQCSNESDVTKGYKVIEPIVQNPELNKIIPPLMLAGIDESRLKTGKNKVKVRYFPGVRTDDMYDYMKPLLRKLPD